MNGKKDNFIFSKQESERKFLIYALDIHMFRLNIKSDLLTVRVYTKQRVKD